MEKRTIVTRLTSLARLRTTPIVELDGADFESGFIHSTPDFTNQPEEMNGASDLLVSVFGERGRHARVAVGVDSLPRNVAVEVDAIFEIN